MSDSLELLHSFREPPPSLTSLIGLTRQLQIELADLNYSFWVKRFNDLMSLKQNNADQV